MRASDEIDKLTAALVAAQGQFPTVEKTKEGKVTGQGKNGPYSYSYRYADLGDVVDATRSILIANGLAVTQFPDSNGADLLTTRLLHTSGQWIEASMRLNETSSPQAQGSALTYARRYAYCAVLGIVADEDDDAQSAQNAHGPSGRTANSRGQGGGAAPRSDRADRSPSRTSNPDRNEYSWVNGGKVPTPDPKAKLASDAQIKRLFGIGKSHDVDPKEAVASLWGHDQKLNTLDWRQYKYLTEAIEDGWRPSAPPAADDSEWTDVPETVRYEGELPDDEPF